MSDTLDRLEQDITVLFEQDVPGPEWDDAWERVTAGLAVTLPGLVAVARAAEATKDKLAAAGYGDWFIGELDAALAALDGPAGEPQSTADAAQAAPAVWFE